MAGRRRIVRTGLLTGAAAAVAVALAAGTGAGGAPPEPIAEQTAYQASQQALSLIERRPITGSTPTPRPVTVTTPADALEPPAVPDPIAEAVAAQAAADSAQPAAFDPTAYKPGASLHTRDVLALVVAHFPADQVGNAMAVSRCESGHANAIGSVNTNGTRDWGVFQLNDGGTLQAALRRIGAPFDSTLSAQQLALDAETNVKAARAIFDSRGWAPWTCAYKTGIVAGLYSRAPGPMYGRYDERGLAGTVDLSRTPPASNPSLPTPAIPSPAPTPEPPQPTSADTDPSGSPTVPTQASAPSSASGSPTTAAPASGSGSPTPAAPAPGPGPTPGPTGAGASAPAATGSAQPTG